MNTHDQMRADWDARAREDAKFYINFRRRNQDDTEFNESAPDVLARLRRDYAYFPPLLGIRQRRFLEIGCGIGRLMAPLAADCGEIHGFDVSAEMLRIGRERLAAFKHADFHLPVGRGLEQFADDSFDFVYSFAVFQHIPERKIIFDYLTEALRVLKPGGVLAAQFNGASPSAKVCNTWVGAWTAEEELIAFGSARGWQLLSSECAGTQYMWQSIRKPASGPDRKKERQRERERERERESRSASKRWKASWESETSTLAVQLVTSPHSYAG